MHYVHQPMAIYHYLVHRTHSILCSVRKQFSACQEFTEYRSIVLFQESLFCKYLFYLYMHGYNVEVLPSINVAIPGSYTYTGNHHQQTGLQYVTVRLCQTHVVHLKNFYKVTTLPYLILYKEDMHERFYDYLRMPRAAIKHTSMYVKPIYIGNLCYHGNDSITVLYDTQFREMPVVL